MSPAQRDGVEEDEDHDKDQYPPDRPRDRWRDGGTRRGTRRSRSRSSRRRRRPGRGRHRRRRGPCSTAGPLRVPGLAPHPSGGAGAEGAGRRRHPVRQRRGARAAAGARARRSDVGGADRLRAGYGRAAAHGKPHRGVQPAGRVRRRAEPHHRGAGAARRGGSNRPVEHADRPGDDEVGSGAGHRQHDRAQAVALRAGRPDHRPAAHVRDLPPGCDQRRPRGCRGRRGAHDTPAGTQDRVHRRHGDGAPRHEGRGGDHQEHHAGARRQRPGDRARRRRRRQPRWTGMLKGVVTRTGQICFAVKRIYVPRSIYDTFTTRSATGSRTPPSGTAWTRGRASVPSTTRSSSTASAT